MRIASSVLALLLTVAPPAHADTPPPETAFDQGFVRVAGTTCDVNGRHLDVHVMERIEPPSRAATWMLQACIDQDDLPSTCVATMTESEPLPPGRTSSGRSFLVRCVPEERLAWVVDLKWTDEGLDLQAWRLDLTILTTAPVIVNEDGVKEVQIVQERPLLPEEPHAWNAGDPRPSPECDPLSLDAVATGSGLDVTIRAASTSCTSWRVSFDRARGSFVASPLPGSAPPDLLRDLPASGPLVIKPGKPVAPAEVSAPAEASAPADAAPRPRRRSHSLSSFSRR